MKSKILKLRILLLLFLFVGAGCDKNEIDYANESIEVSSFPSLVVYKTNGDYINYISFQLTDDGIPNAIPGSLLGETAEENNRYKLKCGYVVGPGGALNAVYTNITFKEYMEYNTKNNVSGWPGDLLMTRIIDYDPIESVYVLDGRNKETVYFTLGQINDMIELGTIETVFEKLK